MHMINMFRLHVNASISQKSQLCPSFALELYPSSSQLKSMKKCNWILTFFIAQNCSMMILQDLSLTPYFSKNMTDLIECIYSFNFLKSLDFWKNLSQSSKNDDDVYIKTLSSSLLYYSKFYTQKTLFDFKRRLYNLFKSTTYKRKL